VTTFSEAWARVTAPGWLEECEARLLFRAAASTSGDLVEFGTFLGRSAQLLAQLGRRLHCVDSWGDYRGPDGVKRYGEEVYVAFLHNLALPLTGAAFFGPPAGVAAHRCRVEDWEPVPAGFVFLDADHSRSGTLAQAAKALACGPRVIAAHDVGSPRDPEVAPALLDAPAPWRERAGTLAVWRLA
jgi:hypothetical protein